MAIYYVDPDNGNDSTGAPDSTLTPFKTFISGVKPVYSANDTVLFLGGTSTAEAIVVNINGITLGSYGTGRANFGWDGSSNTVLRVTAALNCTVTDINVSGGAISSVYVLNQSDLFTMKNSYLSGGSENGLNIENTKCLVEDVEIANYTKTGMFVVAQTNYKVGAILRRLNIHDNGTSAGASDNYDGLLIGSGHTDFLVEDSVAKGNGGLGIGSNFDASSGTGLAYMSGTFKRCIAADGWMGFSTSGEDTEPKTSAVVYYEFCQASNHARADFEQHATSIQILRNCTGSGTGINKIKGASPGSLSDLTLINNVMDAADATSGCIDTDLTLMPVWDSQNNVFSDGQTFFFRDGGTQRTFAQYVTDVSDTGSVNADPLLQTDGSLGQLSPAIGAGKVWWGTGPRPLSLSGEPLPDVNIDSGAYQSTWSQYHPANLQRGILYDETIWRGARDGWWYSDVATWVDVGETFRVRSLTNANHYGFMSFEDVRIANGTTIASATLTLQVTQGIDSGVGVVVSVEQSLASSSPFSDATNRRPTDATFISTTATISDGSVTGEVTVDLTAILNLLFAEGNWAADDYVNVKMYPNATSGIYLVAVSEHATLAAPKLVIT